MANLFGKNKLHGVARQVDTEEIKPFIKIVEEWHKDYHTGSLKRDKETSREQEYNQQFFKTILGYKEKPTSPFSFEPKATTDKGQLPDAVIGYSDATNDIRSIAAVVELKGASIDLDRPQQREGNFSPVQQGFKYKTQYRSVPFVIVSNFWEFRLYQDNLLDYEVWTLDDLVDPTNDYLLFKTWYVLLKRENFTASKGASKTETLLSDIRVEQDNIGKKFYKVYRELRLDLLRDIYKNNDHIKTNIDLGIEKAQKIVDRIVFAAFAEDRGLLPDNTLQRVISAADSSAFGGSLWNVLKGFFEAIDVGSDKLEIPDGYNGGLFKHDDELDNLHISDDPLRKVLELGNYNFAEDLSVNILGHIFEQSISDLEEIKNKVNESQNLEVLAQSRRKKDGIFYTPDYIVRYIVDNSLGAYLREHEATFKDEFGLKGDIQDKTYEKREKQAYAKYQDFLQNVKVIDPACGSGAFLVHVFDYLLAENKRVNDILGNSLFSNEDYVRDILRNNIYGIDLNEESVEITKLSLWLKTAQKGKKLTSLDANIKCGNSLIDDSDVADGKAFDWKMQFAEIFKSGGFDVVVGNPPYVRVQNIGSNEVDYYFSHYQSPSGKLDLSILFFEKALEIINDSGKIAFVSSSQWLQTDYGKKIRSILSKGYVSEIIDFGSLPVFQDADTYPAIFSISKSINTYMNYGVIGGKEQLNDSSIKAALKVKIDYSQLDEKAWQFNEFNLVDKLSKNKIEFAPLSSIGKAFIGDLTGMDEAFVVTKKDVAANHLEPQLLLPYAYRGNEISRYGKVYPDALVIYPYKKVGDDTVLLGDEELKSNYPNIYSYLDQYRLKLEKRLDSRKLYATGDKWFRHLRAGSFSYIEPCKLLFKGIGIIGEVAILDVNTAFNGANCPAIILTDIRYSQEYIAAILNSKLATYYLNSISPKKLGGYYRYSATNISGIPIITAVDAVIHSLAKKAFALQKDHDISNERFQATVKAEYSINKLSPRLNKWWLLDFTDFTNALKVVLSLSEKDELFELYDKYKTILLEQDIAIQHTNREIDERVYSLYGLTHDEIQTVESGV